MSQLETTVLEFRQAKLSDYWVRMELENQPHLIF